MDSSWTNDLAKYAREFQGAQSIAGYAGNSVMLTGAAHTGSGVYYAPAVAGSATYSANTLTVNR